MTSLPKMAAFRHHTHPLLRFLLRTRLLQIVLAIAAIETTLQVLKIRTWHATQSSLHLKSQVAKQQHPESKIFITALHWNNEAILPHWHREVLKLVELLGRQRVYVNILETGSWDSTKSLLSALDAELGGMGVARNVTLGESTHGEFVARRPEGQEGWVRTGRGREELRRIPFLAGLRNWGLSELRRLSEEVE